MSEPTVRRDLPTGTVTFLFTDIEGSTELLDQLGDEAYGKVLLEHARLLEGAFTQEEGQVVDTQGDSFFVVFPRAWNAVRATVAAQQAVAGHTWPDGLSLRVRMGIHTGEPVFTGARYVGLDVHRGARIGAAGHGGQVLLSERACALSRDAFPDGVAVRDLGDHRLKGLAQAEHIYQLIIPGFPADFPPLKTLEVPTTNLPELLTSFVGREREVSEVIRMVAGNRLVTLSGPGGTGKTRLAIQAGSRSRDDFPQGVWLVELASLADPRFVTQTVATTLGIRELPGRPILETLIDFLRSKALLLILDNCEHLVAASAELVHALLRSCAQLRVLATSRAALGVPGEVVYRVPPLSRPASRSRLSLQELRRYEAVQLFVDRVAASTSSFTLTDANAPAVRQIVDQLDGIPLALELAAARSKTLPLEKIAARLEDRFRLLIGGARTGLTHHQTLRATMDWSYDLLTEPERVMWQRLSVFAGGFALEAAEAVCAGDGIEVEDALDLLTQLADKSIVVAEGQNGDVRYRMLETVRQYAQEKLAETAGGSAVRSRHQRWFLDLAEQTQPKLQGPEQIPALNLLEQEFDNLRAALQWSTSADGDASGLRLAASLYRFWSMRGYLSEGRESLDAMLARTVEAPPTLRARALYGAAMLARDQGDFAKAEQLAQQSLQLSREQDGVQGVALTLNLLGYLAGRRGDYNKATEILDESLAQSRGAGLTWPIAEMLRYLGQIREGQGDYARAKSLTEESLLRWRELGDKWGLTIALINLGQVVQHQGDFARARTLLEEAVALSKELNDKNRLASALITAGVVTMHEGLNERAAALLEEGLALSKELGLKAAISGSLGNLGIVAYQQGDYGRARAFLEETDALLTAMGAIRPRATVLNVIGKVARAEGDSERATAFHRHALTTFETLGDRLGIAESLAGLAKVAVAERRLERGALLFGAAEGQRQAVGFTIPPAEHGEYESFFAILREEMDQKALAGLWARGLALDTDAAVKVALETDPEALGVRQD
ncbi:MAG: tetratricopeptide repeat protein [bacterium]